MRIRIDVAGRDGCVSVRIDGADVEDVRRLLDDDVKARLGAYRSYPKSTVTPAMVEAGVQAFVAQGDAARLGRAMIEVYEAMDRVRRARGDRDGG